MKKFQLFCILMLMFGFVSSGQTYKQQFNKLLSKKDTAGQAKLLSQWEATDSNDPELYIAYFNYYVNKSLKEVIVLGDNPKGDQVLELQNQDSTAGDQPAYLYSDTYYDSVLLNQGYRYIDKGIEKFPDRLDMRFGRIYMLGETGDYTTFTTQIIQTIDYSAINKNQWLWTDSKPLDNPQHFMLSSIQGYQSTLYDTQDDSLLNNMKSIAEAVLKYYPDHIESLSNIAVVFMLQNEYDKALEALFKAEKLNPEDAIVLSNIAQAYKLKGDIKNSVKYYERTIKYGDNDMQMFARSQIKALEKMKD